MSPKNKLISIVMLAVIGLFTLSACAAPAEGSTTTQTTNQPHTISVTGSGIAYGKPDTAVAQIGVQTRNPDPGEAVAQNTQKMNSVVAALQKLGVEEKDIQTSNFSVYVQQSVDPEGRPTDITYVADNSVTVTIRDLNKVGDILGDAVAAGANNIYGVSFTVNDKAALEAEAREKAVADAKARAEQLARIAGVTLDKPMTISEFISGPIPFDGKALAFGGGAEAAAVPVSSGQIQVMMQVNVTYIIK